MHIAATRGAKVTDLFAAQAGAWPLKTKLLIGAPSGLCDSTLTLFTPWVIILNAATGQVRSVHVRRLVIKDTIEDRILESQERKQLLADGSLGERHGGAGPGIKCCKVIGTFFGTDNVVCRAH